MKFVMILIITVTGMVYIDKLREVIDSLKTSGLV